MIKSLIRIGLLLLVAIVVYNYFFGSSAEKEQSKKIFGEVKTLVGSIANLVKSEKNQFDQGKYDNVFDKLGDAFSNVRSQSNQLSPDALRRLYDLEKRKTTLQQELESIKRGDQELAQMNSAPGSATGKRGLVKSDAKAAQAKVEKENSQRERKAELQKQLEQLVQETDQLVQKAMQ